MQNILNSDVVYAMDLQLFAEGGSDTGSVGETGVTGTAAESQSGENNRTAGEQSTPETDGQTAAESVKEETEHQPKDKKAEFKKLIQGEFKEAYDENVQAIVRNRLKEAEKITKAYHALSPTLEMLSNRYGIPVTDSEALNKATQDDNAFYEEEAYKMGISVDQLKATRKLELENTLLRQQMEESRKKQDADRIYSDWLKQAEGVKSVYPSFDLNNELQNELFVQLIQTPAIDLRTAYEVIHKDEIIPAAMQFTAKQVEEKIANKIASGGSRPAENGNGAGSASLTVRDVSQLTYEQMDEINARLQRGEKVVL